VTDFVETRCAVCQLADGLVVNTIMAVPSDPPQDGCQLIEIMNGQLCNIGWYWDGVTFIDPTPTDGG
jgi:hypothetical protein